MAGRLAEVPALSGVMCYGAAPGDAILHVPFEAG